MESDSELIVRYLKGDASALDVLVIRHQSKAYRIAYGVLGRDGDARDAVQDAFLKVFRNLPGFAGKAEFSTWLYRIVYNAAIDIGRKRRRYVQQATTEEDSDLEPAEPVSAGRRESREPLVQIAEQERAGRVRKALSELPFKYEIVLRLKDVEGLSYDEIARILGATRANVMSRVYYAREVLRGKLKDEVDN